MCYHHVGTNCFLLLNFILQGYFSVGFFKCLLVILVYKVFITSFVIVQFVRYYICTIQFSQNGLVVLSNCHCFCLFCCFFDMFVYSSFTGMHHSCCTKICVWFVANKALQYTKEQRITLDRFEDVGTNCFHRRRGQSMKMILVILSVACLWYYASFSTNFFYRSTFWVPLH